MSDFDNDEHGRILDQSGELVTTYPPKNKRIQLSTVDHVRREMMRVYQDARNGMIATQDATRLTYILTSIRQTIEVSDLEARIEALEASNNGNNK